MTLYMTLLCICFRYYLCSIGLLSSPKIKIIIYFGHRFPLTSHIRGHLLSAKMALLHLTADIPHVVTQKDKFGLKWPKHYRWAWPLIHYLQTSFVYFYYGFWVAYATMCIATCISYASICIATCVYLHKFPLRNSCIIHDFPILIPTYTLIQHEKI